MTMENDLADKWLVDFCAELSLYLKATSPRKGVYRVEGNGGVSVEFSYSYSGEAAFSHTKNVLRNVFGDRIQALEAELAAALIEVSNQARLRGEAEGKLHVSELAGIVEGWQLRAERAEAELARKTEALRPFAAAADIKLCGEWRDDDRFSQTDVGFHLNFGHLRAARSALEEKTDV